MTRRNRSVRALLLAVALLQLGLPGAAAWADARLDAVAPRGPIHLESHSTQACAPIHPADCVLHRFLSTLGTAGRSIVVSVRASSGTQPIPDAYGIARSHEQQRLPDSRAPPVLS